MSHVPPPGEQMMKRAEVILRGFAKENDLRFRRGPYPPGSLTDAMVVGEHPSRDGVVLVCSRVGVNWLLACTRDDVISAEGDILIELAQRIGRID